MFWPLSCHSSIQIVVTFGSTKPDNFSNLMLLVVTPTGCPREEALCRIWEATPTRAPEKEKRAMDGEEGRAMMDAGVNCSSLWVDLSVSSSNII